MKIENIFMSFGDVELEVIKVSKVDYERYVVGCVEDLGTSLEWDYLDSAMPYDEFVEFVETVIMPDLGCESSLEDPEDFFEV